MEIFLISNYKYTKFESMGAQGASQQSLSPRSIAPRRTVKNSYCATPDSQQWFVCHARTEIMKLKTHNPNKHLTKRIMITYFNT